MKQDQQQLAQDLYLNTDKTQQEIADILDVHRRTVHLWVKKGRWEEMKLAVKQAPALILQDIYNHIEAINGQIRKRDPDSRVPVMQEVEMLRKLLNMTTVIQKKNSGFYGEAFTELLIFISRTDDALATRVRDFSSQYMRGTFGEKSFYTENEIRVNEVVDNLKKEDLSTVAEAQVGCDPSRSPSSQQPEAQTTTGPLHNTPSPKPALSIAEGERPGEASAEVQPEAQTTTGPLHNISSPKPALSIAEGERPGEANAAFCDKNVIFSSPPNEKEKSPETIAGTASDTQFTHAGQPPKYHIGDFSQNVIFQETQTTLNQSPETA